MDLIWGQRVASSDAWAGSLTGVLVALDTSLVVSLIRRVALDSLQLGVGNLLAARMEDSTQFSLLSEDYGSLSRQIAWMKVRAWVERGVAVAVAIAVYLFLSSTSSP